MYVNLYVWRSNNTETREFNISANYIDAQLASVNCIVRLTLSKMTKKKFTRGNTSQFFVAGSTQ